MITIERDDTTKFDDICLEIPNSWNNTIHDMFEEIDSLLQLYSLPSDTISYDQVKDKFDQLRIYWHLPSELEELTEEQQLFYRCLNGMISSIVEKYEKLIKLKIEKGLL